MTGLDWAIIAALASAKVGFLIGVLAGRWGAGDRNYGDRTNDDRT